MTYRQALELGAHVRKGEAGTLVVFADRITRAEDGENGESVERSIPRRQILWASRSSTLFRPRCGATQVIALDQGPILNLGESTKRRRS